MPGVKNSLKGKNAMKNKMRVISDKIFTKFGKNNNKKQNNEVIIRLRVIKTNLNRNNFTWMESHCLFSIGYSSLIKSISKIRQSSLLCSFLKIYVKMSPKVIWGHIVLIPQVSQVVPIVVPLCSSVRWCSRHNLYRRGYYY